MSTPVSEHTQPMDTRIATKNTDMDIVKEQELSDTEPTDIDIDYITHDP